ncbi:MAG: sigma-54 dependent transcriptional regulator [Candidatus Acidiferrales bacterium]
MSVASAPFSRSGEGRILVASSCAEYRKRVLKCLTPALAHSAEAAGGADALLQLAASEFHTVLLDPEIEDLDVPELVGVIQLRYPQMEVVVMEQHTGSEQLSFEISGQRMDEAIAEQPAALTAGMPPVEAASISELAGTAATFEPPAAPFRSEPLPGMIGASDPMQRLYRLARLVAPRDTAVLVMGPTGTGKELVARGIHEYSKRSRGPFVVVNCAAIPESLLEAELFGFTRGAFTGAFQSRLGRIHAAHGGTLLLDEVGELPLSMQAKLLRFVQEGEVQRLGSADLFRVDTRLISATNVDLLQRVREKQFREDLYYRLAVFPLQIAPLRSRQDDILPLAQYFLTSLCGQARCAAKRFTPQAVNLLRKHLWPGNVRELQHWIERAFVLAESSEEVGPDDLMMHVLEI